MAQELEVRSYFHNIKHSGEFIDTNTACKLAMEFFLSNLLFRGDLNKVCYSKEDIAFRRRVETLGKGSVASDSFNIVGLDLPFAIYSQSGSYEPDDRGATQQAGQIVLGQVQPETGIILKAAAVKVAYESTIFFGRRDDVNIASQLLFWEHQPKFPVYFIVEHTLCGYPLDIPVFITLEEVDQNVDYAEKDFLAKSKIFPIKIKLTLRSYQTLIEANGNIKLPLRFQGLYGYNDQDIVLTQDSILEWGDSKFTQKCPDIPPPTEGAIWNNLPYTFTSIADTPDEEAVKAFRNKGKLVSEKPYIHGTAKDLSNYAEGEIEINPDGYDPSSSVLTDSDHHTIKLAVQGYFDASGEVILEEFYQDEETTTETEIGIKWAYREATVSNFKSIILYLPGIMNVELKDAMPAQYVIKGLYPGSEYHLLLITKATDDSSTTYKLDIRTKGEKVLGKKLSDNLIGRTFTLREPLEGK
jgi:hypothetical protein